jgi:hypothetical protein
MLNLPISNALADEQKDPLWPQDYKWGLSVYGAILVQDSLNDIWEGEARIRESSFLVVVALSRELWRFKHLFAIGIEGQIGKHFDEMNHWEFNGLLTASWLKFPWDKYVDTSFTVGDGISYATEVPEVEEREDPDATKYMNYLMFELAMGLPAYPRWDLFCRIHHRSSIHGRIGADDGGSNFVGVGIRYNF